jgi:cell fate regulator YaaT (PSP1 superfamily)
MGSVGRYAAAEPVRYARRSQVVCRTARGLEIGQVLRPIAASATAALDGQIVRPVTAEDRLLAERMERRKDQALEACRQALAARQLRAVLVDVELLLDGSSLYFYFLGESSPELDAMTQELAEVYDSQVQFRQFTDTLIAGCGPDCGTGSSPGCGTACGHCAVSQACGSSRHGGAH